MKTLIVIVALLATSVAQADMYKCVIGGKQTYSDMPCAVDAEKIKVRPAAGNADPEKAALMVAGTKKAAKRSDIDGEVSRLEQEIRSLGRERDAKTADLQARRARTYNNLAGATLEQSISTEMQAVATDYNARIDRATKELDRVKADRAALDKP